MAAFKLTLTLMAYSESVKETHFSLPIFHISSNHSPNVVVKIVGIPQSQLVYLILLNTYC